MKKTSLLLTSIGFVFGGLCAQGAYGIPFQIDDNPSETWVRVANPATLPGPTSMSGHSVGMASKGTFHLASVTHQSLPFGFFDIHFQCTEKGIAGIDGQSGLSQSDHVDLAHGIAGGWSLTARGGFSGGRSTWDNVSQLPLLDDGEYFGRDFGEVSRIACDDSAIAQPTITADTGTPITKGGGTMLMLGFSLIGMAAIGRNKVIRRP